MQDEVLPEDEDEDISLRKRDKSTLSVVITIGDADTDEEITGVKHTETVVRKRPRKHSKKKGAGKLVLLPTSKSDDAARTEPIIFHEADQEEDGIE